VTPDLCKEIIRPVGGERQLKFVILFDTASMGLSPKTGTSLLPAALLPLWNMRSVPPRHKPADEYAGE
jgi:hypothetical protein